MVPPVNSSYKRSICIVKTEAERKRKKKKKKKIEEEDGRRRRETQSLAR